MELPETKTEEEEKAGQATEGAQRAPREERELLHL